MLYSIQAEEYEEELSLEEDVSPDLLQFYDIIHEGQFTEVRLAQLKSHSKSEDSPYFAAKILKGDTLVIGMIQNNT